MNSVEQFSGLPGAELVVKGLGDLAKGERSQEALLLSVVYPRLSALEYAPLSTEAELPSHALYSHLEEKHGKDAHSRYNALLRRIASFVHALERESAAGRKR